jgi:hypothetical protein
VSYPIPDVALDDRLGWIGTSGSGKTYNAGGGIERLLESGAKVVIVDPLDVWWGLRLTADGKPSKFTLPIFGGEHGDLPLNEHAGTLIGETVASMAESCILSLGSLKTKEAERRFMLAFLEALYRKSNGATYHVVFDEADLWAPQGTGSGAGPKLQELMEQIVRRGRVKGFIPWLITQRSAVISKDVLSQVDGLVIFKLTSSNDRKAIGEWVKSQADMEVWNRIWDSLPAMQQGQGVLWIPARRILETVQFPLKETFNSSKAPERGKKAIHRELKPLDLDKLKGKLASIEEEQKASDPRALQAEVARLKRELAKVEKVKAAPPQIVHANADEIEKAREAGRSEGYASGVQAAAQAIAALGGKPVKVARSTPAAPSVERVAAERMTVNPAQGLNGPQQRVLNSLAWWKAFGIDRPTNEQVAFIAGYSPIGGAYGNPRSSLKSMGLIDYPVPGRIVLTDAGADKAETPDSPTTRDELHRRVMGKLNGPQQRVLRPLLDAYPDAMANDDLAAAAGYSPIGGAYGNPRSSLKSLSVIDYPERGMVRASDWLFP